MLSFPETPRAPDNALLTALKFSGGRVGEWNQDEGKLMLFVVSSPKPGPGGKESG